MKSSLLYSLICLLFISSVGSAQYISRYERPISAPLFFVPLADSLIHLNEDSLIAAQIGTVDTTILPPKSTTIALLSSMVIPGAGQIYNGSYWKTPVVWGLGYYFYSVYRNQDNNYNKFRYQYDTSITVKQPNGDTQLRSLRDFHKSQRNEFGWYIAMTYILNILDAYVDAALYNFEVSPNLQGRSEWRMRVSVPIRK
jgi:hypothetical protein